MDWYFVYVTRERLRLPEPPNAKGNISRLPKIFDPYWRRKGEGKAIHVTGREGP
jgi:hypothetical protein